MCALRVGASKLPSTCMRYEYWRLFTCHQHVYTLRVGGFRPKPKKWPALPSFFSDITIPRPVVDFRLRRSRTVFLFFAPGTYNIRKNSQFGAVISTETRAAINRIRGMIDEYSRKRSHTRHVGNKNKLWKRTGGGLGFSQNLKIKFFYIFLKLGFSIPSCLPPHTQKKEKEKKKSRLFFLLDSALEVSSLTRQLPEKEIRMNAEQYWNSMVG